METGNLLACVSMVATGLFGWLRNRDKLRFDAQLVGLQAQIDTCHADRDAQRERVGQLEQTLARHMGKCPGHREGAD
jgi:hypothetical protein